jgi:hypothetical protein
MLLAKKKLIASGVTNFSTEFQTIMSIRTTYSATIFKYFHLRICMQNLDLFFLACVLNSLYFSKNASSPTKIMLHA